MSAAQSPQVEAPPPTVAIRTRPPSPKRLSRNVLIAGAGLAGTIITAALLLGLSPQHHRTAAEQEATAAGGPPETIAQASAQYDVSNLPRADSAFPDDTSTLTPPQDPLWTNAAGQGAGAPSVGGAPIGSTQAAPDPETAARASPILFGANDGEARAGTADRDDGQLHATLSPPLSRYAIQSGNVIPAALVTGLNSDLTGRVIAQVTAPVYDSVTGNHLLIPQGARLIGTYDNGVRYGDHRILLVWNRLILPNGWSINLAEMPASDPTGASGLNDTTDNHLGRLGAAIGLSAIISVIANESQDDSQRDGSLTQSVGDAAAQQAAQTGSQVVQRELNVHPTLRVRPGANVRVLVTRDISLRPYR
jgi:type IV secretion system protein VirB10